MENFDEEEFAPLFDYTGVHAADLHCLSDDDSDFSPLASKPSRKRKDGGLKGEKFMNGQVVVNLLDEDENEGKGNNKNDDEEDWLPPPPKIRKIALAVVEDKTLQALRSTKQELASLAEAARDLLKSASDFVNDDALILKKSGMEDVGGEKCSEKVERERILISIQDKHGHKQFRLFADDKFEKLFKIYAEKSKLELKSLTFSFDGEKVSPTATPADLGLENDDIIEVHVKT